jgi:hypothetical protein
MIPASASAACACVWSRAQLLDELGRVHAREFARLLCRAALLRVGARVELGPALRTLRLETDLACWRREALRARELAQQDGYELPGLLRHALARPLAEWADACVLVEAALQIDACEATQWHAAAQGWFAGRRDARARLREFAHEAASELWRVRAQWLLGASECCATRIPVLAREREEGRWSS